jgi:hypothetical protein
MSNPSQAQDLRQLAVWREDDSSLLPLSVVCSFLGATVQVQVSNPAAASGVALALRASVEYQQGNRGNTADATMSDEVPTGMEGAPLFYYSLQYFSLLPGESRTIVGEPSTKLTKGTGETLIAIVDGWNVPVSATVCV